MGIKHYSLFLKKHFAHHMHCMAKGATVPELGIQIDNLMIDMNGVFHNSAQKVYEYGNYKPHSRLLGRRPLRQGGLQKQKEMFAHVCETIERLFDTVQPKRRLVLCVDGPAPLAKQCIAAGTRISMGNGTSCVIEDITKGDKVWGWNGNGYTTTSNLGLQVKGEKETLRFTLIDGREFVCTADHRILVLQDEEPMWIEAGYLSQGDIVIAGIENPLDVIGDDENNWSLNLGDNICLNMSENRKELLILAKMIGYIMSDGYLSDTEKSLRCALIFGTRIDAELCLEDIRCLSGKEPTISKRTGDKGTTYAIVLPIEWTKRISKLSGMPIGKRVIQPMTIPTFLLDDNCPLSIIREFMGGLFGGDGHKPVVNTNRNGNGSFTPVRFSQSIVKQHEKSFVKYMEKLCEFLTKLGVDCATIYGPEPHTYQGDRMKPEDLDNNHMVRYGIRIPTTIVFAEKIGYRYAHNKSICLTIASSYRRLCSEIRRQEEEIITLVSDIYDNQVVEYKCAYCKVLFSSRKSMTRHQKHRCSENIENNMYVEPSYCTLKMALDKAITKYTSENIILHHSAIPDLNKVYDIRHRGVSKTTRRIRHSIDVFDFLKITNTESWFTTSTYPYEQEEKQLPMYFCPIVDIKKNGKVHVYDIEVNENHSFLANGLCVHNCQQRQRRFRSAQESGHNPPFETSSITPGTKFMDFLTKYVDWFIRKKITEDPKWRKIEVFFSNEKAPGEGEHKLINFIRNHGTPEESYCINGLDADLFMLALGTHMPNFYILREDLYDNKNEYHCIDVGSMRGDLADLLYWESDKHEFNEQSAIDDFIAMCFMVGNDFLPHIPSIEIIEEGIDLMMNVYRQVGESYGHLTSSKSGKVLLLPHVLQVFLGTLGHHEKENFEHKMSKKTSFFPNTLLESCSTQNENGDWDVDIEQYNEVYHQTNFPEGTDLKEMCHAYFEGMQWVLSYYTRGVPNWKWLFPYHYAPSASVLAKHVHTFHMPQYGHTVPTVPFQQLLCVLPPKCADLIPEPLNRLLLDENSPLKEYCPDTLEIDLSGKRREWEGIVILPIVDFDTVLKAYFSKIQLVDKRDLQRNMLGKSFIYKYEPRYYNTFQSYYGDIPKCKVKTTMIEL